MSTNANEKERTRGAGSAMQVEQVPLSAVHPAPWNVRTGHAVEAIAESIRINGFLDPIEAWRCSNGHDGEIVVGEGRYLAAKQLGLETVPVIFHDFDSLASAKRYSIANNRLTERSEWDLPALQGQLEELESLEGTGFDELPEVPGELAAVVEDEVPEPPEEAVTQPGDLWMLGRHRLLCGDATKAEDVERALNGERPVLCVTDPPYGVEYDANWRNEAAERGLIAHAARRVGAVNNDDRVDWRECWALLPVHVLYCWHAGRHASKVQDSLEACGFEIRCQLIWRKPRFAISRGHYNWQHEPCWYAVKKNCAAHWCGDHSASTIWDVALDPNADGGHSTQKPVELMARSIRNHEAPLVFDPFLGSGTTLIAAEQLGRRCYGLEIEPRYCDVVVRRWENLTGQTATRKPPAIQAGKGGAEPTPALQLGDESCPA